MSKNYEEQPPIRIARGNKENLPNLNAGEPALTKDSKELYLGSENGNIPMKPVNNIEIKDGIWSWWMEPLAIRFVDEYDKTYIGWIDQESHVWVGEYNHDNHVFERNDLGFLDTGYEPSDDHCAPVIMPGRVGTDDPIWVFYVGHNANNELYYRKSTEHESIEEFGEENKFTFSDNVSYVQAFRYDETIIVFTRLQGEGRRYWVYKLSDDNGETWTDEMKFLDAGEDGWGYIFMKQRNMFQEEGVTDDTTTSHLGDLKFCVADHPINGLRQDIYYASVSIDPDGEGPHIDPPDKSAFGNLRTGEDLPFEPEDLTLVYEAEKDENDEPVEKTRFFDLTNTSWTDVLFTVFTDETDAEYKMSHYDGGEGKFITNPIVDAGAPIEEPFGDNYYFAGGAFLSGELSKILLIREAGHNQQAPLLEEYEYGPLSKWAVEEWYSPDRGETWQRKQIKSIKKGFGDNRIKALRPISPHLAHPDMPFLWIEGTYTDDGKTFDTNINIYPINISMVL